MRITVSDTRLFFDVDGQSLAVDGATLQQKPTLILLHGGPGFDHAGFKPHFSSLADAAQLIYLDHRGNGRSDRSAPDRWTLTQWADDLAGFCAALEIERPVIYGVSFGGMVAQAYAIRYPGQQSGLIFDSTAPRLRFDLSFEAFQQIGGTEAREAATRFWENVQDDELWETYMRVCYPLYNRNRQDPKSAQRSIINKAVLRHFFDRRGEGRNFDFRDRLGGIQVPHLVLAGRHDPIVPPELSRELFDALPSEYGRLEIFEDAGHGVYRDKPSETFDLIRQFLATIDQGL